MNCIKKFSRIVCVSLFSYQGCFAVSSLRQLVYFIISFRSCQALFSKVFEIFQELYLKLFVSVVLFKRLDYFIISSVDLSTVNLNFLKTILFFSISEAIPCDSLFILPLPQGEVKHFLQKVSYFLYKILLQLGAYIYPTFQPLTISLIRDSVTYNNLFIIEDPHSLFSRRYSLCISSNLLDLKETNPTWNSVFSLCFLSDADELDMDLW